MNVVKSKKFFNLLCCLGIIGSFIYIKISEARTVNSREQLTSERAPNTGRSEIVFPLYSEVRKQPIIRKYNAHYKEESIHVTPLYYTRYKYSYEYNRHLPAKKYKYRNPTTNWSVYQWH